MSCKEIRGQQSNKLLYIFLHLKITEVIEGRIKRESSGRLLTIRFFHDEYKFLIRPI